MIKFLLRCPKCRHNMLYGASSIVLTGKRKRCVYCGHSFKVSEHILKQEK